MPCNLHRSANYAKILNKASIHIARCPARLIGIIGDHAQEVYSLAKAIVETDTEKHGMVFPSKLNWKTEEKLS